MLDAAVDGTFKGLYIQGEDILQSDPNTQHVAAGLAAMECVVVQDLFLNETANYAHVFLPGSTFLEKDGTFTNAERRIQPVRKVMAPQERLRGLGDHHDCSPTRWATRWHYDHPSEIMDEIAAPDADLRRRLLREARRARLDPVALQRQGAGRHAGHAHRRLRARQGQVRHHRIRADRRATGPRFPLLLTTGPHLCQYNVGAQTRRTANVVWHEEDVLEIHPHDAEHRGIRDGDWVKLASRAGETTLRARDHRARAAGRRLHDLPPPRRRRPNVVTTEYSDWATNCPEYKVTAVQVSPSNGPSEWQEEYEELTRQSAANRRALGRGGIGVSKERAPAMSPDRLVYMANQIGKFFEYQRPEEVVPGITDHIQQFWDPRMREAIFAYMDAGGEGIDPKVREALEKLKAGGKSHTETSFQGT